MEHYNFNNQLGYDGTQASEQSPRNQQAMAHPSPLQLNGQMVNNISPPWSGPNSPAMNNISSPMRQSHQTQNHTSPSIRRNHQAANIVSPTQSPKQHMLNVNVVPSSTYNQHTMNKVSPPTQHQHMANNVSPTSRQSHQMVNNVSPTSRQNQHTINNTSPTSTQNNHTINHTSPPQRRNNQMAHQTAPTLALLQPIQRPQQLQFEQQQLIHQQQKQLLQQQIHQQQIYQQQLYQQQQQELEPQPGCSSWFNGVPPPNYGLHHYAETDELGLLWPSRGPTYLHFVQQQAEQMSAYQQLQQQILPSTSGLTPQQRIVPSTVTSSTMQQQHANDCSQMNQNLARNTRRRTSPPNCHSASDQSISSSPVPPRPNPAYTYTNDSSPTHTGANQITANHENNIMNNHLMAGGGHCGAGAAAAIGANGASTTSADGTTLRPGDVPFEWMQKRNYQPNPGKTRTKEKYRVVYTEMQRVELEKEFYTSKYITIRRKSELAAMLSLSERQVKIWFQNRRAKDRKLLKKRLEQETRERRLAAEIGAAEARAAQVMPAVAHPSVNGLAMLSISGPSSMGHMLNHGIPAQPSASAMIAHQQHQEMQNLRPGGHHLAEQG